MRNHAKALPTGFAHPSALAPRALSRPLAIAGLLLALALAFALALAASPAKASFVQTDSWSVHGVGGAQFQASADIAADLTSGDVFSSFLQSNLDQPGTEVDPGRIDKWLPDGTPGTPASFGGTFSAASNYAGVAIDPTTHNVYALVDPISHGNDASANPKIAIFQPDGTLLGSFPVSTTKVVGIDVDASGNVWVPDPANGVVNKYDGAVGSGTFGNLLDTTGGAGGSLNDPVDVALDGAGNLYVADKSTNRVDEKQTVDLEGNTGGTYRLTYEGAPTGVAFTGDVSYGTGSGDLVEADGTADRSLLASATGTMSPGSNTITDITGVSGTFSVGASISSGQIIPFGTTIAACSPDCSNPTSVTLSEPVPIGAINSSTTQEIHSGSKVLTNVTNDAAFQVGMGLVGLFTTNGIPFASGIGNTDAFVTTITAVDTVNHTITLSDGVTSASSGEAITGEYITNVQTDPGGAFAAGQKLLSAATGGGGIPVGIASVNGGTIVPGDVFPPGSNVNSVQLTASSPTITNVNVTSGQFSPNIRLHGNGIEDGAAVGGGPLEDPPRVESAAGWNLSAKKETIAFANVFTDLPFTSGGTGVSFHADLKGPPVDTANIPANDYRVALEAVPTIGATKYFPHSSAETASISISGSSDAGGDLTFQNAMGGRNLSQMTCASVPADPLTGGSGDCSVTTATDGSNTPGRVAKFGSNGDFLSNFIPPTINYTADAIAVDKSSGDVYVASGNGDWGNPQGVIGGPDAPDFSVKRYDSGGNELDQIGVGELTANTYLFSPTGAAPRAPAFGLSYDPTAKKLYTVGRATDLTYTKNDSVVKVFSVGHTLTVDPEGTGTGIVDADSGAIANCSKSGGTCTDDYVEGEEVTLSATEGALSDFTGWSVDGQPGACPGTGDCTVTMDADITVHATFTQTEENLTVVKEGGGTGTVTSTPAGIDCGSTCGPVAFPLGASVELEANEDPGSAFAGWSGGGCSGTGICTVTLNTATTVHATFAHAQELTVVKEGTGTGTVTSTPAGIDCGSTCGPVPFPEASNVELTASTVTADHSTFAGWSGGGCSGTGTCTVTMNAATTVNAKFEHNLQNLSVIKEGTGSITVTSTPAGINCGATCGPVPFNEASNVTLHAATNGGHTTFNGWTVTGQPGVCPGTGDCTVTMNAATTVHASSTLRRHDLTVSTAGNGAGTVSADSTIIDGCTSGPPAAGVCTESDVEGSSVTLTATPGAHSTFSGWSGGGCSGTGTCTVSVDADTSVTATFTLDKHSLTVAKSGSGSGSVTCDGGACASSYDYGSTVTLAASAASGSHFTGWSGACSGSGACTVTIDGDKSVSAGFDTDPVTPTAIPTPGPKSLKCKKGFKKKKVHGKVRCVKVKKHKKHHKH